MIRPVVCLVLLAVALPITAEVPKALLRHPDLHGDRVVFASGGDLWWAPVAGGVAVRLTIDDGDETLPRFSPDGQWIAFTADIDGNADVYVMGRDGNGVRRLTYHPGNDEVVGWHPVSGKVLFRATRQGWPRSKQIHAIAADGTGLETLPLPEAGWVAIAPDGNTFVYNRDDAENRTWKRYKGGLAPELEIYDSTTKSNRRLTDYRGADSLPMWLGDRVVFSSDRDGNLDLWSIDPRAGGEPTQLTHHNEYDARRPSDDGVSRIVYESGGSLRIFHLASGEDRAIPIEVVADAPEARPAVVDVADAVNRVAISPSGARTLVTARGEVFSVPREHGATRNLSRHDGARDEFAVWSPDGAQVAFLSDRDGEWQVWLVGANGGEPRRLTNFGPGYRHNLRWSPDGSKLSLADQTLTLLVVDAKSGAVTKVDKAEAEAMDIVLTEKPIHDAVWSPDSRFLAYTKLGRNGLSQVWLYDLGAKRAILASDGRFNDQGPAFSADGRHLFFTSSRHFEPVFDDFEWEMVFNKTTGIYAIGLAKTSGALLPLRNDAEPVVASAATTTGEVRVRVDAEGLAGRIEALPVPRGNYRNLTANGDALFALNGDGDFNRIDLRERPPQDLVAFDFEERELVTVQEGVVAYDLSASGKTIAARTEDGVVVLDAKPAEADPDELALDEVRMTIDPRAEWAQIYWEAWRLERDFFYDEKMHGLDWKAIGDRYGRLLPAAASRRDLQFLIGEMIGELATSHTYIFGGDSRRTAERVGVGLLGADYRADEVAKRWRFERILSTPDFTEEVFPPLARPGVDVAVGDYLLAVDGIEVTTAKEPWAWFQDRGGKIVTLSVASKPSGPRREVLVETVKSEADLRYEDWVERNRLFVLERSGGTIGYIHLPDTFTAATQEFSRQFLAQTSLAGLVIDGRFNGGGLDPDIFLQRLAKRTLAWWTRRHSQDYTSPLVATRAHMALLTNHQAGSGGDMLPHQFRQLGLGPVIGTRSWGGLVGVSSFIELIDGGGLTAPDYRIYDENGQWLIENEGVTPDIEVDLLPGATGDAQLETALQVVQEAIAKAPRPAPTRPTAPSGI